MRTSQESPLRAAIDRINAPRRRELAARQSRLDAASKGNQAAGDGAATAPAANPLKAAAAKINAARGH